MKRKSNTETIDTELRVVHSHQTGIRRERIAGEWVETPIDSHWWWATTMPRSLAEGFTIFHFGHDRWKIVNEGFNELVSRWHSSHCFHHHPNFILVLWLILFMTHAVFPLLLQAQPQTRGTPRAHRRLHCRAHHCIHARKPLVAAAASRLTMAQ